MKTLTIPISIIGFAIVYNFTCAVEIQLQCSPSGFQCANETAFIICVEIGDGVLVPTPSVQSCPESFVCINDSENPCTESTATTTEKSFDTFKCRSRGKFPGPSCRQYYLCTRPFLHYKYEKKLRTCQGNKWFNAREERCTYPERSNCRQYKRKVAKFYI